MAKNTCVRTHSELEYSSDDSQKVLHLVYLSFKISITNNGKQSEKIYSHTHILCIIYNVYIIHAYIWLYLILPLLSYGTFHNSILKQTLRVKYLSIVLRYRRGLETQA